MNILKLIERDIDSVKENIDTELKSGTYTQVFDGMKLENADEVLEQVLSWDNTDDSLSFDAGYIRGLEALKVYTFRYKLKSSMNRIRRRYSIEK
tara:strand:+ start:71 stop:352 length:282 start_codon:yes stop_codon:yes gene_type:complete